MDGALQSLVKLPAASADHHQLHTASCTLTAAHAHLQDKVRGLTDNLYSLEVEHSRSIAQLSVQLEAAQHTAPLLIQQAAEGPQQQHGPALPPRGTAAAEASGGGHGMQQTRSGSPAGGELLLARAKSLRSGQLAQRVTRLEGERLALARERDELQLELHHVKAGVCACSLHWGHGAAAT